MHTAGRKEVVEILLEAGMDPNSFDTEQGMEILIAESIILQVSFSFIGTLPLHEAVTFFRFVIIIIHIRMSV